MIGRAHQSTLGRSRISRVDGDQEGVTGILPLPLPSSSVVTDAVYHSVLKCDDRCDVTSIYKRYLYIGTELCFPQGACGIEVVPLDCAATALDYAHRNSSIPPSSAKLRPPADATGARSKRSANPPLPGILTPHTSHTIFYLLTPPILSMAATLPPCLHLLPPSSLPSSAPALPPRLSPGNRTRLLFSR